MPDQDYRFLSHFITEPIYIIPEPQKSVKTDTSGLKNSIFTELPPPKLQEPAEQIVHIKSLGAFDKNILIAVDDASSEFLNEQAMNFLVKILSAVHLSLDNVAIVNMNSLKGNLLTVTNKFDYKVMLVFGIQPTLFNEDSPMYEIKSRENRKVLYSDALTVIEADKTKKLKLWENLQKLFIKK